MKRASTVLSRNTRKKIRARRRPKPLLPHRPDNYLPVASFIGIRYIAIFVSCHAYIGNVVHTLCFIYLQFVVQGRNQKALAKIEGVGFTGLLKSIGQSWWSGIAA